MERDPPSKLTRLGTLAAGEVAEGPEVAAALAEQLVAFLHQDVGTFGPKKVGTFLFSSNLRVCSADSGRSFSRLHE